MPNITTNHAITYTNSKNLIASKIDTDVIMSLSDI